MRLTRISPAMSQTAIKPLKANILRRLRVPILAATMAIGGAFAANAQTKTPEKDTYEPKVTVVNDTIKSNTSTVDTLLNIKRNVSEDVSVGVQIINENGLGLDTYGSAAKELLTKVVSNISNGDENPYSAIYLALMDQDGDNPSSDINIQMNNIIESMQDYARDHKEEIDELMKKNGSITEFHYGPDNSKTGTLVQNLNITGLNESENKDNAETDTINQKDKNFVGNVAYNMKAITEHAEVETNINAGSDNLDIQLAAMYKTKTQNGGDLALSLNGRETMEGSNTSASAGASLDYTKNKFSTGLYYYTNKETDEDGDVDRCSQVEGYLKYKQNVDLTAGMQTYDFYKYYYSELKLYGITNLTNSNLKLSGALTAEVGSADMDFSSYGYGHTKMTNLDFGVVGGIYFKTDDIKASLNGRASYNRMMSTTSNEWTDNIDVSVLGAFSNSNIAVSAMLSLYKDLNNFIEEEERYIGESSKDVNICASVGFEIKDLLKGISPQVSYTSTSINNQIQHFFNVTVKTSLESLRKNK